MMKLFYLSEYSRALLGGYLAVTMILLISMSISQLIWTL